MSEEIDLDFKPTVNTTDTTVTERPRLRYTGKFFTINYNQPVEDTNSDLARDIKATLSDVVETLFRSKEGVLSLVDADPDTITKIESDSVMEVGPTTHNLHVHVTLMFSHYRGSKVFLPYDRFHSKVKEVFSKHGLTNPHIDIQTMSAKENVISYMKKKASSLS